MGNMIKELLEMLALVGLLALMVGVSIIMCLIESKRRRTDDGYTSDGD